VPWSISLFGVRRHPVQLYEIFVGFLALATWWTALRRPHLPGHLFLVSAAVYAAGRLFVDAFRADPWLTSGGYHVLQIISLLVVLASLFLLALRTGSEEASPPLAS
jgi:prolipoprotein diacylglyceryltransferase